MHHAHINLNMNTYAVGTHVTLLNLLKLALLGWFRRPFAPMTGFMELVAYYGFNLPLQTHGDAQCRDGEGGLDCQLQLVPAPFGHPFAHALHTDAMMEDARSGGAPTLESWAHLALRVSRNASRVPLGSAKLMVHSASRLKQLTPLLPSIFPDEYFTYRVPMQSHSYVAGRRSAPAATRFVDLKHHHHGKAVLEHWALVGNVSEAAWDWLGERVAGDGGWKQDPAPMDVAGAPTIDELQSSLRSGIEALRAGGYELVLCVDGGPQTEAIDVTEAQHAQGWLAGSYDRKGTLRCDAPVEEVVSAGETGLDLAQVVFHRPVPGHQQSWFPMHGVVFASFALEPGTEAWSLCPNSRSCDAWEPVPSVALAFQLFLAVLCAAVAGVALLVAAECIRRQRLAITEVASADEMQVLSVEGMPGVDHPPPK